VHLCVCREEWQLYKSLDIGIAGFYRYRSINTAIYIGVRGRIVCTGVCLFVSICVCYTHGCAGVCFGSVLQPWMSLPLTSAEFYNNACPWSQHICWCASRDLLTTSFFCGCMFQPWMSLSWMSAKFDIHDCPRSQHTCWCASRVLLMTVVLFAVFSNHGRSVHWCLLRVTTMSVIEVNMLVDVHHASCWLN